MEPTTLGRYQIERVLGKGAMGVVYLARDPVIGRALALKTLTVPGEIEEALEFSRRFMREAQAAGRLNHPGIVTVHDTGVDEATGFPYIAMEYIEGRSLKDTLRSGQTFAFSEVARIAAALAGALDYAHQKGVVHRDIKPANIILTPQGTVKITDFGVARLESSNLTTTGQFIGTPNYMSPEQVIGAGIDGRSDLFSLGVVLFELLTGARPFAGSSLTEVTYKIVHEPPPIPSQARPGLPSAFNPIVLKLLEKDPAKRYARGADAARALDALRRVLQGMPTDPARWAPAGSAAGTPLVAVAVAPTATRATELSVPADREPDAGEPAATVSPSAARPDDRGSSAAASQPSIWQLPIETRWVVLLTSVAALIPAAIIAVLLLRIDRGPFLTPPAGEPARRHHIGMLLREAAAALAAGRAGTAASLAAEAAAGAPYSPVARDLRRRALQAQASERDITTKIAQARRLQEEGKELLRQGRHREALGRFESALELVPDDPLAREYRDLARERVRSPRLPATGPTPAPVVFAAPTPEAVGTAKLDIYFNSPIAVGTVVVRLDDQPLANKPFDFRTRGFLGMWKNSSGEFRDSVSVPSGRHTLAVRLLDGKGSVLGEQSLPAQFAIDGRYSIRIDMDSQQAVPRFSLRGRAR